MNATESKTTEAQPQSRSTYRLVFPHGVTNLTIRIDESMPGIYRGEFYGPKPVVTEGEGVISIDYPRFNPLIWGRTSADVSLSPSVAWMFEIRGGVSHWNAELRTIELGGIDVRGGLSHVDLRLPPARGGVRIHVGGGASDLMLRRPGGSSARVEIGGGASKLAVDDQAFGAVGGPVALETPGYSSDHDRYIVEIGGGASKVTVARD
jgi:hypothetical protein